MQARWKFLALVLVIVGAIFATTAGVASAEPVSGAVFTTDSACSGTDLNLYGAKSDVYLDGGPAHSGAAGLPDGSYYVQVTDPSGAMVLGKSAGADATVLNGEFVQCYQLTDTLYTASSGFTTKGYDDTPNAGGVYKVWVSTSSDFTNSVTKTDNFKVEACDPETEDCTPVFSQNRLTVEKFYDADANGLWDNADTEILGWQVRIQSDAFDQFAFTAVNMLLDPAIYTVSESDPVETNWIHTTPTSAMADLTAGDQDVTFGNICLVSGHGGLTLGFWSNRNGQALISGGDLTALQNQNLVTATGVAFQPTTAAQVRSWLLSATATNMAYMLSAQLAATTLDVLHGFLSDSQLIYAPSLTAYGISNSAGFTTIGAVRTAANNDLGALGHNVTLSASPYRAKQEALKNVLDGLNNNTVPFASATPCAFSFATQ